MERCGVADEANGFLGATSTDTDIDNVNVPATTLDAWADLEGVRSIDLLAIDTEGMGPEVLPVRSAYCRSNACASLSLNTTCIEHGAQRRSRPLLNASTLSATTVFLRTPLH